MGKFTGKKCRLLSMMVLTGSFFFVEIVVGYVTNSMTLVADSFHMLGDIAALVISFLSVKVIIINCEIFFPPDKTKLQTSHTHHSDSIAVWFSFCRCHQRNGPKIHLDGHVPKY